MHTKFMILSAVALLSVSGCVTKESSSARLDFYEGRGRQSGSQASIDATPISAQPHDFESKLTVVTGKVSLLDAVNLALSNNRELRAVFMRRDEAQGMILEAKSGVYPQVQFTLGATGDMAERGDNSEVYSAAWSVAQPLWRSGVVLAGMRLAEYYSFSADEEIRSEVQRTMADVMREYYGVLLSKHMVAVYTDAVGVAERMLETARTRKNAGAVSAYEVLRAEVEVASTKAALIKEQNSFRTASVELLQKMGINQSSSIILTGALEYRPQTNSVAELTALAMMNRPDLLLAEAAVKMAEEERNVAKGAYGPTADLVLKGEYANPDPNDRSNDEWNHDWGVGVQLNYKLFDGFQRKGKLVQADAKLRQAHAKLDSAEEIARVEIVKALLDVRNADELYRSQAKNIDLSREALRIIENGHKVGRNTQIEVLDAQSALTEAMGRYYNAIYAHALARLAVQQATGVLGFPATRTVSCGETITADSVL